MSDVEDVLRRTLTTLVGDAAPPDDGLSQAKREARRRNRRARVVRVAAVATVAASGVAVAYSVIDSGDDRVELGTTPTTQPRPESTASPTTANGSTTSPTSAIAPVLTGGPAQLFATGVDNGSRGLLLLSAESGEQLGILDDLTHLPYEVEGHQAMGRADLAPDGSLYYSIASGPEGFPSIWRLAPDGTMEAVVAKGSLPAVSPNGRDLAYVTTTDGVAEGWPLQVVVVRDLAEGSERRWMELPNADAEPWASSLTGLSWDPKGDRLAFSYQFGFESEEHQMRVLDLDADSTLADAEALPGRLTSPAWLADGSLLAVEPLAQYSGRAPLVRFEDPSREPVRDERFASLNLTSIDVDRTKTHLLATAGAAPPSYTEIYVLGADGTPHRVTDGVWASW